MFYLLSFFTGILECGWIFRGLYLEYPLWLTLLFVVGYHLGNLFPLPFALSKRVMCLLGFAAIVLAKISFFFAGTGIAALSAQGAGIFLDSVLIQSARSGMKTVGNRVFKRICRVGGFLASPLAIICPSLLIILGSVLGLIVLRKAPAGSAKFTPMTAQNGFSCVMMLHQLHYFFYAHITLALAASFFGIWSALGFALTWAAYLSVEPVLKARINRPFQVFLAGHSLIAVMMLILAFSESAGEKVLFVIIWIAAGFGGGTVFTITDINKAAGCFDKSSETIAENLGHVIGVFSAAVCAMFFTYQAPAVMAVTASASALCTIAAMTIVRRKVKCKSIQ